VVSLDATITLRIPSFDAARACLIAKHGLNVIVESPARHERVDFGRNGGWQQARHKRCEVIGVRADVAKAPCRAGQAWIGAPGVAGLRFIQAVLTSSAANGQWRDL
jgi:hypothetical protein